MIQHPANTSSRHPHHRKITSLGFGTIAFLALIVESTTANAATMIYPGTMSLNPSSVSHGQLIATKRWAIDATGTIQTVTVGENVSYDYSATPTPYGNWSIGGPAQGSGTILNLPFTAGNLANVVDIDGNLVTLVHGMQYTLAYTIKPSEFSYGSGFGTWAIGQGNNYNVDWSYGATTANSLVTLDVDQWKTVSFDFTYESGNNFIGVSQSLNGGAPTVTRLSGSGGPTPGANINAPTIQFAGASPSGVPEPAGASTVLICCVSGLLIRTRQRRRL